MKRDETAKIVAFCAMLSALSTAILAIGSLISVLDISLALIAGTVVMIADMEFSGVYGWSVFVVTALLSLLLPSRAPCVLFIFFFGWYPLFRKVIFRWNKWLRIITKVVLFNALVTAYIFASVYILGLPEESVWMIVLTFVLANLMFSLYEPALDRVIRIYYFRLRDRLGFHK